MRVAGGSDELSGINEPSWVAFCHQEASVAWWYFFSKIIEFLDTVSTMLSCSFSSFLPSFNCYLAAFLLFLGIRSFLTFYCLILSSFFVQFYFVLCPSFNSNVFEVCITANNYESEPHFQQQQ